MTPEQEQHERLMRAFGEFVSADIKHQDKKFRASVAPLWHGLFICIMVLILAYWGFGLLEQGTRFVP